MLDGLGISGGDSARPAVVLLDVVTSAFSIDSPGRCGVSSSCIAEERNPSLSPFVLRSSVRLVGAGEVVALPLVASPLPFCGLVDH